MHEIRTERLFMRDPETDDLETYLALVSDYEVVKWTTSWPYPADRNFTLSRCQQVDTEHGFVCLTFHGDEHIGGVSCFDGELGYFIVQKHWGKGYATEMARAVLARAFAVMDWDQITAGVFDGNPGSVRVLEKLGFRETGRGAQYSNAQGKKREGPDFCLTRADWLTANPYELHTERLIIRGLVDDDWRDLQRIGDNPEVARMMFSVKTPWPEMDVKTWLAHSIWQGRLGFRPAVTLKDGTFVGTLGIGGHPCTCAYFLDRSHWGRGYATEAMAAFLTDSYNRFGLDEIQASHFVDNPASGRVLQKLGFIKFSEGLGESAARLEDDPEYRYRLIQTQFKAIR